MGRGTGPFFSFFCGAEWFDIQNMDFERQMESHSLVLTFVSLTFPGVKILAAELAPLS